MIGLRVWADWFEHADRRVAHTLVLGLCNVSTVFLGIDHRFIGDGPPILFETMAFWPVDGGDEQMRCSTWLQAEAVHRQMVAEVARPRAVLAYVGRMWSRAVRKAREDWERRWRELRGVGRPSTGDVHLDALLQSMDQMQALIDARGDREW